MDDVSPYIKPHSRTPEKPYSTQRLLEKAKNIGQFILGEKLGEGTFGVVRLATHILTGEKVAVKILEKRKILEEADVTRIEREIKILKMLHHNNIVQLYSVTQTSTTIYLIMEYASGKELFDYIILKKRLPEIEACKFYQQILSGIEYLHKLRVVHRDLKPENLLLDSKKDLKIADFGLSNLYPNNELLKTACGSPCYAAPEMINGKEYKGHLVDIWSSGIILFAMICGYLPFEDADNDVLYRKITEGRFSIPRYVSEQAKDLLRKVLNVDPSKRYGIKQIKKHPWFNLVNQRLNINEGLLIKDVVIPIDEELIMKMEEYKFSKEEVRVNVLANKHNHITTTYYLLLRAKMRKGIESVAIYNCEKFMKYIKDAKNFMKRYHYNIEEVIRDRAFDKEDVNEEDAVNSNNNNEKKNKCRNNSACNNTNSNNNTQNESEMTMNHQHYKGKSEVNDNNNNNNNNSNFDKTGSGLETEATIRKSNGDEGKQKQQNEDKNEMRIEQTNTNVNVNNIANNENEQDINNKQKLINNDKFTSNKKNNNNKIQKTPKSNKKSNHLTISAGKEKNPFSNTTNNNTTSSTKPNYTHINNSHNKVHHVLNTERRTFQKTSQDKDPLLQPTNITNFPHKNSKSKKKTKHHYSSSDVPPSDTTNPINTSKLIKSYVPQENEKIRFQSLNTNTNTNAITCSERKPNPKHKNITINNINNNKCKNKAILQTNKPNNKNKTNYTICLNTERLITPKQDKTTKHDDEPQLQIQQQHETQKQQQSSSIDVPKIEKGGSDNKLRSTTNNNTTNTETTNYNETNTSKYSSNKPPYKKQIKHMLNFKSLALQTETVNPKTNVTLPDARIYLKQTNPNNTTNQQTSTSTTTTTTSDSVYKKRHLYSLSITSNRIWNINNTKRIVKGYLDINNSSYVNASNAKNNLYSKKRNKYNPQHLQFFNTSLSFEKTQEDIRTKSPDNSVSSTINKETLNKEKDKKYLQKKSKNKRFDIIKEVDEETLTSVPINQSNFQTYISQSNKTNKGKDNINQIKTLMNVNAKFSFDLPTKTKQEKKNYSINKDNTNNINDEQVYMQRNNNNMKNYDDVDLNVFDLNSMIFRVNVKEVKDDLIKIFNQMKIKYRNNKTLFTCYKQEMKFNIEICKIEDIDNFCLIIKTKCVEGNKSIFNNILI